MSEPLPQAALDAVRTQELLNPDKQAAPKFADNQTVYVKRGGKLSAISGADANTLFSGSGAVGTELASQDEFADQQVKKSFEGTGRGLAAAAIGASAIGGIIPSIVRNFDPATANAWNQHREERPGAYMAGEVGGLLATALIPGGQAEAGAGLAARLGLGGARALAAPVRGASALGGFAEGLAARGLAGAGMAETGLATRVLAATAGQAVEGGLYGLGNAVTDAALKGDDLTSEKLLAGIGHGALIGGVAGGGLKAAGGLFSRAGAASSEVEQAVSRGLSEETSQALARATPKADSTLGSVISQVESSATKRALGVVRQDLELLAKNKELETRLLTVAHEELPAFSNKSILGYMSKSEIAEAAPKLVESYGQRIGAHVKELDALVEKSAVKVGDDVVKTGVDMNKVYDRIASEVEAPALAQLGGERAASIAANLREDLSRVMSLEPGGATFKRLHSLRGEVDDMIRKHHGKGTIADELGKDVRRIMEDELIKQADVLTKTMGDADFVARYTADKLGYRAAKIIEKGAEKNLVQQQGTRFGGLSEQLGLLGGLASAGLSGGLVGFAVQRLVKDRGAQAIASIAHAAGSNKRLSAVTGLVEERAGHAVERFATEAPAKSALRSVAVKTREALSTEYNRTSDAVRRVAKDPAAIANAVADIRDTNPAVAESLTRKATTATAFLESKLPQERSRSPLQPQVKPSKPSPAEMSKFVRYAKAVDDPLSVFEDASKGAVSREGVEALKAVYPALYRELQGRYGAAVANRKQELSYPQKVQMAVLFGIPADASFMAVNIKTVQKALTPAPAPPPQGPPPSQYKSAVASVRSRELGSFSDSTRGEELWRSLALKRRSKNSKRRLISSSGTRVRTTISAEESTSRFPRRLGLGGRSLTPIHRSTLSQRAFGLSTPVVRTRPSLMPQKQTLASLRNRKPRLTTSGSPKATRL